MQAWNEQTGEGAHLMEKTPRQKDMESLTLPDLKQAIAERLYIPLEKVKGVNLAELFLRRGEALLVQENGQHFFHIEATHVFSAFFSSDEFAPLEALLRERRLRYTTRHMPPNTLKHQADWLMELELSYNYSWEERPTVHLVEFGYACGTILVNALPVGISHTGHMGRTPGTWYDWAIGFFLTGPNRVSVFQSLIDSMKRGKER